ncbi:MAG TPA: ParA family protein [Terriglobales bacterium]|jgi:cellulose biosynthesis protein BcsQ|nr:ParA family protein [Terriglobales bacterium]
MAPKDKVRTLSLFNHKGGVGKTTLTVNLADAFVDLGFRVLLVDADPQCNLTSFYLKEKQLDELLGESDDDNGTTLWSAIKPVVDGKGPIKDVKLFKLRNDLFLCAGDVLLADYEEELPAAWTGSFARKERDYDVMCSLSRAARALGAKFDVDLIMFDVGPNVGPLNRAILLDMDFFATPVAADLFSLRALSTVGRALARWITDWATVRQLASPSARASLLQGKPVYLGYITSAYKVASGQTATHPHEYWEAKIAPRVRDRIVEDLRKANPALIPHGGNKIGAIKDFHSLAPQAQKNGLAIGKLKGHVNGGYYAQVEEAASEFEGLAREMLSRMGMKVAKKTSA